MTSILLAISQAPFSSTIGDQAVVMTSTRWRTTGSAGHRLQPASRNSSVRSADRSWLVRFRNKGAQIRVREMTMVNAKVSPHGRSQHPNDFGKNEDDNRGWHRLRAIASRRRSGQG